MTTPHPEMIDIVFDVSGEMLPATYPYALWEELTRLAPELLAEKSVGVIPMRIAESNEGLLLPKRAKLALRLPLELVEVALNLAQKQMQIGESALRLGAGKTRPIQPHPTLHAHLVTGADDEVMFVAEITEALGEMRVQAKLICGQRRALSEGDRVITGYSLVLHDLSPEDSLRVQYAGLGKERRFGCGIFVPYKVISSAE